MQLNPAEISELIKKQVENFDSTTEAKAQLLASLMVLFGFMV